MNWFPDWTGQTCAIIACGPSANREDAQRVRGLKTIVVNRAYELAPWADVLYACDTTFWMAYPKAFQFEGLKVTIDADYVTANPSLNHVEMDRRLHHIVTSPGMVGHGKNGGFQALNLAIQFGCRKILLLGFDMAWSEQIHFHGPHKGEGLRNPEPFMVRQWHDAFRNSVEILRAIGARVVNCTPGSALTAFPVMTIEEALCQLHS